MSSSSRSRRWRSALYVVGSVLATAIIAGGSAAAINRMMVAEGAPGWVGFLVGFAFACFIGFSMGRLAAYGWVLAEDWRNVQ